MEALDGFAHRWLLRTGLYVRGVLQGSFESLVRSSGSDYYMEGSSIEDFKSD